MFRRLFPRIVATKILLFHRGSFIHTTGWLESIKKGYPCNREGQELPWMNYSFIAFLEKRLRSDLILFEYGSGSSTLYFARHVGQVTSLEHDPKWHRQLEKKIPANVKLILIPLDYDGAYCRRVQAEEGSFDIIVVDGRDRVNCLIQSFDKLSEHGVMILDDSHRERYCAGRETAKANGFLELEIEGVKVAGNRMSRSTIFYRRDNCLGV